MWSEVEFCPTVVEVPEELTITIVQSKNSTRTPNLSRQLADMYRY